MSEKEKRNLRDKHPQLFEAFTHGTLMESNFEFVAVAKQYPATAEK